MRHPPRDFDMRAKAFAGPLYFCHYAIFSAK